MTTLLMYLAVGAFAGTLAGLFGIGGGMIIVPAVLFALAAEGVGVDVMTHMAVATSLATIVFTSLSSIRAHHLKGAINWQMVSLMTMGIIVGTSLGVVLIAEVPGPLLLKIIGVFAALLGIQMFFGLQPRPGKSAPGHKELGLAGAVIGFGSSWFGIGGGTFSVPYLSWRQIEMRQAVATSAACGLPIALTGALTNIWSGWGNPALPAWSTGFVYWPAVAGIVITSVPFARLGAHLAHRLDQRKLKKAFAVLLIGVSIKFLTLS
ncbi:sulfite exporter TauE/SafE family protein [Oceanobacter sp. 5_MG-2023]|uniref:sulfite exporter TauE/SafE family protein n=2 Tax=Gammaproteobacteria TaxID=1236 RepID=UPI0034C5E923